MKKLLLLLSVCSIISPLAYAEVVANADTKGHQPVVAPAAKPEDNHPWLKNVSGTAALVTNYMFRGISQSRNLPAAQVGLTYTFPVNIYANVWASNASFVGTPVSVEVDTVLGYRDTYGDNFAFDLNMARYNYPGARSQNYNEFNSVFNYYFLQLGYSYSANVYNLHQAGRYYNGGINYDIPSKYIFGVCDVNLLALVGHYALPYAAGSSYNDYNVMLTKAVGIYNVSLQWTSTNGNQHYSPYDGSTLIGQVATEF